MTYRNGTTRGAYSPVASMATRPHPPCTDAFGGGELTDDHMAAICDAALIAAGVVGVVTLGLVVKWLVESIK